MRFRFSDLSGGWTNVLTAAKPTSPTRPHKMLAEPLNRYDRFRNRPRPCPALAMRVDDGSDFLEVGQTKTARCLRAQPVLVGLHNVMSSNMCDTCETLFSWHDMYIYRHIQVSPSAMRSFPFLYIGTIYIHIYIFAATACFGSAVTIVHVRKSTPWLVMLTLILHIIYVPTLKLMQMSHAFRCCMLQPFCFIDEPF
jgi:hypothetical protein